MKTSIEDLNYLIAHEELNLPHIKIGYTSNPRYLLKNIITVINNGIRTIPYLFQKGYYKKLTPTKYILLAFTGNNIRTLTPIQEKVKDSSIYEYEDIPLQRIWIYALLFFPIVLVKYFISSGYMKKAYASEFTSFSYAYGYYFEAKRILKRINPFMIIIANDHSLPQRAFFRAAQSLNIKTAYIQHASVSENFPPLEFDFAFLDGQESLDKYTANNRPCKSQVYFYGSPRFDVINALEIKKSSWGNKCGIAINAVDFPEKIANLIHKLRQNIDNISITIRSHPAMDDAYWSTFANENQCLFSNPKVQNPFHFIAHNDFFISGESSFHLDAVLSGKTSLFYNFTDKPTIDHYGYLKSGLIKEVSKNWEIIENNNEDKEQRRKLIQYYVANYQTPDWGRSAALISSKIEELANLQ